MRTTCTLIGAMVLAAAPAFADPNPQLALSVAHRLSSYGIDVDPEALTTEQASALHLMLVTKRDEGYSYIRRRAKLILTSPRYRD